MIKAYCAIHLFAIAWALTGVFGAIAVWLTIQAEWKWLAIYLTTLHGFSNVSIPLVPLAVRFFVGGASEAAGGCQIVYQNPIADRSRESVSKSRPSLYAIHPHGLTSTCAGIALSAIAQSRGGERVSLVVASFLHWFNPVMRILLGLVGVDLISSSAHSVKRALKGDRCVGIVVGGFEEMLRNRDDADFLYLTQRKGFIKYAMQHGYSITPVYCFGESMLYSNALRLPRRILDIFARWKVPFVIPIGGSLWNAMPNKLPQGARIAFGESLNLKKNSLPSNAEVEKMHAKYLSAITDLYNRYNPYPHRPLVLM